MRRHEPTRPLCDHRIGPEQEHLSKRIWRDYHFNLPCAHVDCPAGFNHIELVLAFVSSSGIFKGPVTRRALLRRINVIYTDWAPVRRLHFRPCVWSFWESEDITVTVVGVESGHGLCPECMTVDRREQRAAAHNYQAFDYTSPLYGQTIERDDVEPDPECPTCHGAATGIERPDVLGALLTVLEDGRPLKVGMGISDADKAEWMHNPPIGRKCDVKIQVDPGCNEIVARHASWMRWRDDV